jgi:hypothetical protein
MQVKVLYQRQCLDIDRTGTNLTGKSGKGVTLPARTADVPGQAAAGACSLSCLLHAGAMMHDACMLRQLWVTITYHWPCHAIVRLKRTITPSHAKLGRRREQ